MIVVCIGLDGIEFLLLDKLEVWGLVVSFPLIGLYCSVGSGIFFIIRIYYGLGW